MIEDPNKRENFYHAALLYLGRIKTGSPRADDELKALLQQHGNFFGIRGSSLGPFSEEILRQDRRINSLEEKLKKIPFDFRLLTVNDEEFPDGLRNISGSTPVLYTKGDLELLKSPSIAVVGTRDLIDAVDIEAGKKAVQRFLYEGYVIVSGLAKGCDTLAHEYAIEHDGKTIAVLGTPLDKYYPRENKPLQDKIASEHLLVSQYPIGIRTVGSHFANRNRTTLGLASSGVVVIRAGDKSGTQHAIRHCLKQGKKLYVLENNLNEGYEWVKKLAGKFEVI